MAGITDALRPALSLSTVRACGVRAWGQPLTLTLTLTLILTPTPTITLTLTLTLTRTLTLIRCKGGYTYPDSATEAPRGGACSPYWPLSNPYWPLRPLPAP